jgi:hypothetical protein
MEDVTLSLSGLPVCQFAGSTGLTGKLVNGLTGVTLTGSFEKLIYLHSITQE